MPWLQCPPHQYFEYRNYKSYASFVIFAVASADRRFIYAIVGCPGVLGDTTIFNTSDLKRLIDDGRWIGTDVPSLQIGNVHVRPYLMDDCAFVLARNMITTASIRQQNANKELILWDLVASATRKPIECVFGIVKNRFPILRTGIRFTDEDDAVYFMTALLILHNLCISHGDTGSEYEFDTTDSNDLVVSDERPAVSRLAMLCSTTYALTRKHQQDMSTFRRTGEVNLHK